MAGDWGSRVYAVFNTSPRSARDESSVWLSRPLLETALRDLLSDPVVSICVDGPSGTGKTSLARTTLDLSERRYVSVEVTSSMDWLELCKSIVEPNANVQVSTRSAIAGEVKAVLPGMSATRESSQQRRPSDGADYIAKVAQNWSERDVINHLRDKEVVLVLDNLEQASEDILKRLSDLAKGMSDRGPHPAAKLIFVGANDIYSKILNKNPSLSRRLRQVSVGAFRHQGESWRFLSKGFDSLRMLYPGISKFPDENRRQAKCVELVYRAAGGLPKSLNELGKVVALKARTASSRKYISASDIEECAELHFRESYEECKRGFPGIISVITKSVLARESFMYLYRNGIGNIHSARDLVVEVTLRCGLTEDQVETGICELVDVGFVTRSGIGGNTLFTMNPELAHVLGIVLSNPAKFSQESLVRGLDWQLQLPGWE